MSKPKTKVFIDASNIFFTQKKLGWMIDWKKAKRFLNSKFKVLEIRYYSAYKPKDKGIQKFFSILQKLGFILLTKPIKKIKALIINKKGREKEVIVFKGNKGNMDVEITRDSLLDRQKYDYLILFSGDSDFAVLKKDWQKLGRKLIVFSSRKTISWELKLVANKVFYLEDLKKKIFRKVWGLTPEAIYGKNKSSNRTR